MTSTRSNPAPRPALRKAPDGSVHPASPRGGVLRVAAPGEGPDGRPAGHDGKARDKGKKGRVEDRLDRLDKDDKIVDVVVSMPKSVRRRLRRKAEEYGWTAEEAAYHLARTWVDG
jgi:hypothetical protein